MMTPAAASRWRGEGIEMELEMSTAKPTRPVLRYHGGKFVIADWVIGNFPEHRVYCEPFCGSASVFMRKNRSDAEVINDLQWDIVNVFRVLRDKEQAIELERLLKLTPFARAEFDLAYTASDDPIEQARRTIVRSFQAVGNIGATRISKSGWRSTVHPNCYVIPAQDWPNYSNHIQSFVRRLSGVIIENRPAIEVIERYDCDDCLHYIDPPYVAITRSAGVGGYRHEMTDNDHRELARALRSVKGMAIISGYPCDLYDCELYPDWKRVTREALADGARKRIEVLWISPNAERAMAQQRLFR